MISSTSTRISKATNGQGMLSDVPPSAGDLGMGGTAGVECYASCGGPGCGGGWCVGGGGGGGGYYGGGGAGVVGGGFDMVGVAGGGGGGSSYAEASATNVSMLQGVESCNGQVFIVW